MGKILAAMSGGVDSTVAAALLQRQGHEVTGVMLRLFDERAYGVEAPSRTCCSITDIQDARNAALKLSIPFHVFNFSGAFRTEVIDRFAAAYAVGHTPNPCLDCNRYLKFGALLQHADTMGFDAIATGHYARTEYSSEHGRWLLKTAQDTAKDQSYVLYTLTQSQLARLRLPLGGLTKPQVRAQAEQLGLGNAQKPDSQDICFVPDGDYAAFLQRECSLTCPPGDFVDIHGNVLGRHKGILHYTVGQRRGLGVSGPEAYYVLQIDAAQNRVVLGTHNQLLCPGFVAAGINWILPPTGKTLQAEVRTRYHQKPAVALLHIGPGGSVRAEFAMPQRAPAPGQAAVFYSGDIVLGGGTIQHSL